MHPSMPPESGLGSNSFRDNVESPLPPITRSTHARFPDCAPLFPVCLSFSLFLSVRFALFQVKKEGGKWEGFHAVLSLLSYMLKAPLVPPGTPVVNALFAQRQVS